MGTPYSAFRNSGVPTGYAPNKTAVSVDVTFAGLVYAFLIITISFLAILPGIRRRNRIYAAVRFFVGMFIGVTILLSTYGQDWEVASQRRVHTAYKAFTKGEIFADIGVNIGLRNVNVTLKGVPEYIVEGERKGERINYNERFTFCCNQGRRGFGPFAGPINQEFRAAQWKGLPYPILWIVEYFTLDGEDIRWGRSYRMAGFYTFMVMWTAFCLWVLALALSFMVIRYCGIFLVFTGISMLSSNVIYATVRYGQELVIPFGEHSMLEFSKGGSFYLCMIGGIVSTLVGIAIVIFDDLYPFKAAVFFNVDPLQDYQDAVTSESDVKLRTSPAGSPTRKEAAETDNGSARPEHVGRPLSVLNEDPRAEQLAEETVDGRQSEGYKGDMYVNVAEMRQTFISGRKTIFRKNKPRRKQPSRETDSADHGSDQEDLGGNTSSLQRLQPAPVKFSVKRMGSKETVDDSVVESTALGTGSIRMSELAHENEVDITDES